MDLEFLGGKFFDHDLPKDKNYLFKYFKKPAHRCFIRYYFLFNGDKTENLKHFRDHSGYFCSKRWIFKLMRKVRQLEKLKKASKEAGDIDLYATIESGKFKFYAKANRQIS